MTLFENDPANTDASPAAPSGSVSDHAPAAFAGGSAAPPPPGASVPEDLRISWSWLHFLVFLLFAVGSLLFVQLGFVTYLASFRRIPLKEVERMLMTRPPLIVAMQVAWFALLLLFLYVTLAVLRDAPFWKTVGWRALAGDPSSVRGRAWAYFFSGCALALLVAVVGYGIHPKEKLPIQELFKDRSGALLLLGLAVLVAPLVEETLFRGYLYPLFARKLGVPVGIVLTGVLFGTLHGAQLGWTKELVGLLTLVGLVFTYVRARTGTVLASYLLHLGYNSMIALSVFLATRGFQHFPPGP